ncbi:LPS assembly lipoprotein LptE [Orbus sturtevantii]|uniref:LPS assembly lipoprotein LptE n=1 Tax=Orbus sturtevantii TaxID=3074109 RepID=UPI00370CFC9F
MKKLLLLFTFIAILLSGCGFHLQDNEEIPKQFQTMAFYSGDPYGPLSREIKKILIKNKVKFVDSDKKDNYPSLHIENSSITRSTISLYQDGKSAEYQLILTLNAKVVIAGDDIYPITIKIFRTFFDNPETALAKSTEQNLIEQEMYGQSARQLIRKLRSINIIEHKN